MSILILSASTLAAAFVLTTLVRRYAVGAQILDVPNARSSHEVATPRGGGIAIVLIVLIALPYFWFGTSLPHEALIVLGIGGAAVAAIGWCDDRAGVSAKWRLIVHLLAAAFVTWHAALLLSFAQPSFDVTLLLVAFPMSVLFITWVLNLYNFMDGIDGIAGVEAVTVAGVVAILLWWVGEHDWAMLSAVVASASMGFLAWNWPPAKIFLGDIGSGFLGFILATLAVLTWIDTLIPIWTWLILLGVFVVDATVTLLRRALRRESLHHAHRSHAYQHAARRFGGHRPVTIAVLLINLLWLAPLGAAATFWSSRALLFLAIAWCPLVALCFYFRAGLPDEELNSIESPRGVS